jgi:hypothetical protein
MVTPVNGRGHTPARTKERGVTKIVHMASMQMDMAEGYIILARKYFRDIRTYKCAGGGERGTRFVRWLARSPLWSVSYPQLSIPETSLLSSW